MTHTLHTRYTPKTAWTSMVRVNVASGFAQQWHSGVLDQVTIAPFGHAVRNYEGPIGSAISFLINDASETDD